MAIVSPSCPIVVMFTCRYQSLHDCLLLRTLWPAGSPFVSVCVRYIDLTAVPLAVDFTPSLQCLNDLHVFTVPRTLWLKLQALSEGLNLRAAATPMTVKMDLGFVEQVYVSVYEETSFREESYFGSIISHHQCYITLGVITFSPLTFLF